MEQKTDRRIRKTKRQLRQGLAKLMEQKSINEITVKELVEEVDINRSTFYLHYADIYDMLEKIENELMEEIIELINATEEHISSSEEYKENGYEHLVNLFTMLDNNRDICKALAGPHGDLSFITKIEDFIASYTTKYASHLFSSEVEKDLKYVHAYCITGCVGMVKCWITKENNDSPEHIARFTYNILMNSLNSFLKKKPS